MWDVLGDENSPYINQAGQKVPIIRGGIIIPLFQGGNRDW
jgi:hypothetical protein